MSQANLERATVALDKGDHQAAIKLLKIHLAGKPADVPSLYLLGAAYQESQNFDEALKVYGRVLALQAHHFGAHYGAALILLNRGCHQQAMAHHDAAIRAAPRNFWAYVNRGISKSAIGQLSAAIADYDQALSLNPNLSAALTNKGNALTGLGHFNMALACHEKALSISPRDANAWNNMGSVLLKLERYADAEMACRKSLDLAPRQPTAWSNLGRALYRLKRHEDAEAACRKVIEWEPDSAEAWSNLAAALSGQKRHGAAETASRKAIELEASSPEAWRNLSAALLGLKRFAAAEAAAHQAVELAPQASEAWNNLGAALSCLKRHDAAEAACRKALEFCPGSFSIWNNLGNALYGLKRYDAAAQCYEKCLELDPEAPYILGGMIHCRMRVCDWRDFERNRVRLVQQIVREKCVLHPFPVLALVSSPAAQRMTAETFAQEQYPPNPVLGVIPKREKRDRIRLGYYSSDFRNHVVSYLAAGLFECHDKERFELIAFSLGVDAQDEMRGRVSAAFDQFIDVGNMSDQEVARLSRELGIDIAIDLNGYTEGCRTGIFACRAAPLQVNYLGYTGTMGAEYIDYIVADRALICPESRCQYAERIVYLPDSFQVNDARREVADNHFSREALGLPTAGFVFCCFNNSYKITPTTFDSWMRILTQVEGAVLWLLEENPIAVTNMKMEAAKRGVVPERLLFARRLPHAAHIARISLADLVLDTLPYNAHATASDALWAGVPVLTLLGETFAGRVAASLLNAMDLPELIATSEDGYEHLATKLATHPEELELIKEKLARNRLSAPLFDTPRYTRYIEAAYGAMFERYQADLPPEHLFIER